ncbi:putative iron sulphur protein (Secreted protein) [Frankia sp. AiPs1]|uniref:Rieske (2Fe-2S) protein n=1 Tax=Frankia sp. AiPa1 TaxID=573492 RepID=UPI00202B6429|nr:Rieske (2Fe-2S) protein [Frankia sp. AiPa1]MCL9762593.1 Rieske (2Fe-2S) protein [Frankia sp. AiPa1]
MRRGTHRFVEDLLRGRRPRPFAASPQDAAELRTAITLRASAPGADAPSSDFLADLHRRLAAGMDAEGPSAAGPAGPARPARSSVAGPTVPSPADRGLAAGRDLTAGTGGTVDTSGTVASTGSFADDPAFRRDRDRERERDDRRAGSRRRFVGVTSVAAAAATVGGVVGAFVQRIFTSADAQTTPSAEADTLMPASAIWSTVATSQELPEGGVRAFDVGTVTGYVRRSGGQVRAVSGVCTHQGCQLALDAAASRLNCPCHRTSFSLSGEVVHSQLRTPPRTLPDIQVRELSGVVQVYSPPRPA